MIRVLLADDQALIRAGFRAILHAEDGIEVVAEASSGEEAVALAAVHHPDVVLMDIRMPRCDGIWATGQIVADYVIDAIAAGASGFLVKDTEPVELIRAVRVVASGDALLSPGVTRTLLQRVSPALRQTVDTTALAPLTEREREVLALVGRGLSNDEIGAALFLSPLTAKTHVSRIMQKLDARDRVRLVVVAYESGLVAPGWG
jgi:DNA-binding NarL/FixJ family response regulator